MSQTSDMLKQFRDATDALGARVTILTEKLIAAQAGAATAADLAERDAIVAQLNAMGVDPSNPVPVFPQ